MILENIKEMSNKQKIIFWMQNIVKLPQYTDLLINSGYDTMDNIYNISLNDLKQIGINKYGHNIKIFQCVQKLNDSINNKTELQSKSKQNHNNINHDESIITSICNISDTWILNIVWLFLCILYAIYS